MYILILLFMTYGLRTQGKEAGKKSKLLSSNVHAVELLSGRGTGANKRKYHVNNGSAGTSIY